MGKGGLVWISWLHRLHVDKGEKWVDGRGYLRAHLFLRMGRAQAQARE